MNKPVILIGAGGHALVLLDTLEQLGVEIKAVIAPKNQHEHRAFSKYKRYEHDSDLDAFNKEEVLLVNGLGGIPGTTRRHRVFEEMKNNGYEFMTVVSENATVSQYAELKEGVQIYAAAVVQAGVVVGENSIINTSASIDHGCNIGANSHIAPGATLSGDVKTGPFVHVATGAIITQGVSIGQNSVIGAGVSVVKDVVENTKIIPLKSTSYIA